jgi:hypothetical protein
MWEERKSLFGAGIGIKWFFKPGYYGWFIGSDFQFIDIQYMFDSKGTVIDKGELSAESIFLAKINIGRVWQSEYALFSIGISGLFLYLHDSNWEKNPFILPMLYCTFGFPFSTSNIFKINAD